jgi:flagellar biosynthetic protein FlhB
MAEHDSAQERTEEASPRKRQEARDKGQVPRSRELNTAALLIVGAGALLLLGGGVLEALGRIMRASFQFDQARLATHGGIIGALGDGMMMILAALVPLLAVLVVAAVASSVALGGFQISPKALGFQWERISPAKGFARMFSAQGLMELVKSLAKFAVIASIAVWWLMKSAPEFLVLGDMPVESGLAQAGYLIAWAFLVVALGTLLMVAVDVPFKLWQHNKQLRMTKQELRDEFKETDGKPEVKQQIRKLQQEIARRRMMEEVPKADVIVTNPTHYAVALRYEPGRMRAPKVVAKGMNLIAQNIRKVGEEHKVAVYEAPPLARALYHSTDLNQEIPEGLYLSVAQVLAYIFQLKNPQPGVNPTHPPEDLPIPPELRWDA